jgi:uncharacterized protein YndB with AHSA1/START domain/DNA-binding transcriptional ArsR family regulator
VDRRVEDPEQQAVFRALADPTRRAVLDALFEQDGQTLSALVTRFPDMSRFGVMKHLTVLHEAGLVLTERSGREKRHFLNPVPIAEIAGRWISRYAQPFTTSLVGLKAGLETATKEHPMTAHLYQIYIHADIDRVFQALTDPAFTVQYFHATAYTKPPIEGEPYLTTAPDGSPAADGVIEVLDPPHRLVQTWHARYDEQLEAEAAGRVEWLLTEAGRGVTLLRLRHDGLEHSPLTSEAVKDGWVWILDSLKTLLETGRPLPRATEATQVATSP